MKIFALIHTAIVMMLGSVVTSAQQAPVNPPAQGEAEVVADPIPPEVPTSAVAAVNKLGEQVVLGRFKVAVERMNPLWKERIAKRIGGMAELERKLDGVAAEMVKEGISMISFKSHGKPTVYQVSPGRRAGAGDLVYTRWLVFVPTTTTVRIIRKGVTKPLVIESIGYQVAISDKGKNDWTFIDGAGLNPADLRGLFGTLPADIELPPVEKREVR